MKIKKAFGTWTSPLTPESLAAKRRQLSQLRVFNNTIYWLESRPQEAGRQVLMRSQKNKAPECLTPADFNVRSRVHEYGGGDYWLHQETLYFVNDSDQRLYRYELNQQNQLPIAITPKPPQPKAWRYIDGLVTNDGKWILCVQELHDKNKSQQVENRLALIPTDGHCPPQQLASGDDFYLNPRLSPDNKKLAWISWNQPNMPWEGNTLWQADFDPALGLTNIQKIAGGEHESIFQPEWGAESGTLYFISDQTGWWNLYRSQNGKRDAIAPMEKECAFPQWGFCSKSYSFLNQQQLALIAIDQGIAGLYLVNNQGKVENLNLPYTAYGQYGGTVEAMDSGMAFIAATPHEAMSVIYYNLKQKKAVVLAQGSNESLEQEFISEGLAISYPSSNSETAHGFFYQPCNKDCRAPENTKPPLLVMIHGGPTSATDNGLSDKIQFWTTRGFAVLDVNYGGSTGYGRAYRERLNDEWGEVDVNDCINGVRYLINQDLVNAKQVAIRGGSAGGFTVLRALTTSDLFSAGACYYGVADLSLLLNDTHKFEARYLDHLIGPYPEKKALYLQRSPINDFDKLNCPLIIFQGLEDKVVPPSQSEAMVAALKAKKLEHEYITYPNEQHGFRCAENIADSLRREYEFYCRVWGI